MSRPEPFDRRRYILVVADSVGIGALPDADEYGDADAHTLGHILETTGCRLPNLQRLGLGNITPLPGHPPVRRPSAWYGKAALSSRGKDTTVGHWEMTGIITHRPFPTYPHGFPPEIMSEFEKRIDRHTLGNVAASGTEIIRQLGAEHMKSGQPIVYTSADSVFQIAAHEAIIPVEDLYRMCHIARDILQEPHRVARVIARPFTGEPGHFSRTVRRKDFAVPPPEPNLLSELDSHGHDIISIGKVASIFAWQHTGREIKTGGNAEGIRLTSEWIRSGEGDLVFTNLVDFDMLYGHRNDATGYARALEELDRALTGWIETLHPGDVLMVTADHGCDPTTPSTDHSREYVPILGLTASTEVGGELGVRDSLADIGQTIAAGFGLQIPAGQSFLDLIG